MAQILEILQSAPNVEFGLAEVDARGIAASHGQYPISVPLRAALRGLPRGRWICAIVRRAGAGAPAPKTVEAFLRSRDTRNSEAPPHYHADGYAVILVGEQHLRAGMSGLRAILRSIVEMVHAKLVDPEQRKRERQQSLQLAEASFSERNPAAVEMFQLAEAEHGQFRQRLLEQLQQRLDQLRAVPPLFRTAEEKLVFATLLTRTLTRVGLRLECPREGCAQPATLKARAYPSGRDGMFLFIHNREGRVIQHASSLELPPLRLVLAPDPDYRISL